MIIKKTTFFIKNLFFKPFYNVFITDKDGKTLTLIVNCFPSKNGITFTSGFPLQDWDIGEVEKIELLKRWGHMSSNLNFIYQFSTRCVNKVNYDIKSAKERDMEKHYMQLAIEFDPVINEFYKVRRW